MSPIKLILFDVDGTLVKTDGLLFEAFSQIFTGSFGFPEDTHSPQKLRQQYQGSLPEKIFDDVMAANAATGRYGYEEDFKPLYEQTALQLMKTIKLESPEGLQETFNDLTRQDIKIGAISNSLNAHVEESLNNTGLWNHIFNTANIWTPDKNHLPAKPAPDMILTAMAHFDITAPHEVLFIGDTVNDKKAAQAAGCHFIHTPILADELSVATIQNFWKDEPQGRFITHMSQLCHEIDGLNKRQTNAAPAL